MMSTTNNSSEHSSRKNFAKLLTTKQRKDLGTVDLDWFDNLSNKSKKWENLDKGKISTLFSAPSSAGSRDSDVYQSCTPTMFSPNAPNGAQFEPSKARKNILEKSTRIKDFDSPSTPGICGATPLQAENDASKCKETPGLTPLILNKQLFKTPQTLMRSGGSYGKNIAISLGVNLNDSNMSWTSSLVTPTNRYGSNQKELNQFRNQVESENYTLGAARALFTPGNDSGNSSQEEMAVGLNSTVDTESDEDHHHVNKCNSQKMLKNAGSSTPISSFGHKIMINENLSVNIAEQSDNLCVIKATGKSDLYDSPAMTSHLDDVLSVFVSPPSQSSVRRKTVPRRTKRKASNDSPDSLWASPFSTHSESKKSKFSQSKNGIQNVYSDVCIKNSPHCELTEEEQNKNTLAIADNQNKDAESGSDEKIYEEIIINTIPVIPKSEGLLFHKKKIENEEKGGKEKSAIIYSDVGCKHMISPKEDFTQISPTAISAMCSAAESVSIGGLSLSTDCITNVKNAVEITKMSKTNMDIEDSENTDSLKRPHLDPKTVQEKCDSNMGQIHFNQSLPSTSNDDVIVGANVCSSQRKTVPLQSPLFNKNGSLTSANSDNSHNTPLKWKNTGNLINGKIEAKTLSLKSRKSKRFSYPTTSQIFDVCPKKVFNFDAESELHNENRNELNTDRKEVESSSFVSNEDGSILVNSFMKSKNDLNENTNCRAMIKEPIKSKVKVVPRKGSSSFTTLTSYIKANTTDKTDVETFKVKEPFSHIVQDVTLSSPLPISIKNLEPASTSNEIQIPTLTSLDSSKEIALNSVPHLKHNNHRDVEGNLKSVKTIENTVQEQGKQEYAKSSVENDVLIKNGNKLPSVHFKMHDLKLEFTERSNLSDGFVGFSCASGKSIKISDHAKQKASAKKIESEIQHITTGESEFNIDMQENKEHKSSKTDTHEWNSEISQSSVPPTVGFKSASGKSIVVSDHAKQRASALVEKINDEIQHLQSEENQLNFGKAENKELKLNNNETDITKFSASLSVGFQSASGKTIQVSDRAKQRASALVKEIDNEIHQQLRENPLSVSFKKSKEIYSRDNNAVISDMASAYVPPTVGFQSASGKAIKVSDNALDKAASLIETVDNNVHTMVNDGANTSLNNSLGFHSASGKAVSLSETSVHRAHKLMEEVSKELKPNPLTLDHNLDNLENTIRELRSTSGHVRHGPVIASRRPSDSRNVPQGFKPFKPPRMSKFDEHSTKKVTTAEKCNKLGNVSSSDDKHIVLPDKSEFKDNDCLVEEENVIGNSNIDEFTTSQRAEINEGTAAFLEMDQETQFAFTQVNRSVSDKDDHDCKSDDGVNDTFDQSKVEQCNILGPDLLDKESKIKSSNTILTETYEQSAADTKQILSKKPQVLKSLQNDNAYNNIIQKSTEKVEPNIGVSLKVSKNTFDDADSLNHVSLFQENIVCPLEEMTKPIKDPTFKGFCTAGGKSVSVSTESLKQAQNLFSQLDEEFEVSAKMTRNNVNSRIEFGIGTHSRGKGDVGVSENILNSSATCFNESGFVDNSQSVKKSGSTSVPVKDQPVTTMELEQQKENVCVDESGLGVSLTPSVRKNIILSTDITKTEAVSTFLSDNTGISDENISYLSLKENLQSKEFMPTECNQNSFAGFSTASGKIVNVSADAMEKTKMLFNQQPYNSFSSSVQHKNIDENKETCLIESNCKSIIKCDSKLITMEKAESSVPHVSTFEGFQTAGDKKIIVSNEALKVAKAIIKETNDNLIHEGKITENILDDFTKESNSIQAGDDADLKYGNGNTNVLNKQPGEISDNRNVCDMTQEPHANTFDNTLNTAKTFIRAQTENTSTRIDTFRGFQTASGKSVKVSEKSLKVARTLIEEDLQQSYFSLAEFESENLLNIDNSENNTKDVINSVQHFEGTDGRSITENDDYVKSCANEESGNEVNEKIAISFPGFQTASGSKVLVSDKALKAAKAIIDEIPNETLESKVISKDEQTTSNSNKTQFPLGFQTASGNKVTVAAQSMIAAKSIFQEDKVNFPSSNINFKGFSTANGQKVVVSDKALQAAKVLVDDVQETGVNPIGAFQTAGGKSIRISEKSLKEAKFLLNEEVQHGYSPDTLSKIQEANEEFLTEKSSKEKPSFQGFQTAGGKKVNITDDSLLAARSILKNEQSVPVDINVRDEIASENNIETSSKMCLDFGLKKLNKNQVYASYVKGCETLEKDNSVITLNVLPCEPDIAAAMDSKIRTYGRNMLYQGEHFTRKTKCTVMQKTSTTLSTTQETNEGIQALLADGEFDENYSPETLTVKSCMQPVNSTPEDYFTDRKLSSNSMPLKTMVTTPHKNSNKSGNGDSYVWTGSSSCNRRLSGSSTCDRKAMVGQTPGSVYMHNKPLRGSGTNVSKEKTSFNSPWKTNNSTAQPRKESTFVTPVKSGSSSFKTPLKKCPSSSFITPVKSAEQTSFITPVKKKLPQKMEAAVEGRDAQNNLEDEALNDNHIDKETLEQLMKDDFDVDSEMKTESDLEGSTRVKIVVNNEVRMKRLKSKVLQGQKIKEKKQKGGSKQNSGMMFREKSSGRQLSVINVTGNATPSVYSDYQLYSLGVRRSTLSVTSKTASDFRFNVIEYFGKNIAEEADGVTLGDGAFVVMDDNSTIGKEEMCNGFFAMDSVEPKLISRDWVNNHYRWIVWKLAAYEIRLPQLFAGRCFTPDQVMLQLKYRYDREIDRSHRSALKKIYEKDDSPQKCMVLCVSDIFSEITANSSTNQNAGGLIEVTDGWYSIKAVVDGPLCRLLHSGRLKLGDKIVVYGAERIGNQDGCLPLQAPTDVMLKIYANSARRVKWNRKLGYCKNPQPEPLSLSSLYPSGGLVGCVDVVITRVYPMQYFEKKPDGSSIFRCGRAEERSEKVFEKDRQKYIETVYAKLQDEYEKKVIQKEAKSTTKWCKKDISMLQNGRELLDAYNSATDPSEFESLLTNSQQELLHHSRSQAQADRQATINAEIQKTMMDMQHEAPSRKVTPLLKVRVSGCNSSDIDSKSGGILSIWRPKEDVCALLKEGHRIKIYNLTAGEIRGRMQICGECKVSLTGTKTTRYQPQEIDDNFLDLVYEPREAITVSELKGRQQILYGEVDIVAVVIQASQSSTYDKSSGEEGHTQTVFMCDRNSELFMVKFWGHLTSFGLEDLLIPGACVACANLTWKSGPWNRLPMVTASEVSMFTTKPRQKYLKIELDHLIGKLKSDSIYVHKLQEKLTAKMNDFVYVSGKGASNITTSKHTALCSPVSCNLNNDTKFDDMACHKRNTIKTHNYDNPNDDNQCNLMNTPKANTSLSELLDKRNSIQKDKAAKLDRYMNNLEQFGSPVTLAQYSSPRPTTLMKRFKAPGLRRRSSFGSKNDIKILPVEQKLVDKGDIQDSVLLNNLKCTESAIVTEQAQKEQNCINSKDTKCEDAPASNVVTVENKSVVSTSTGKTRKRKKSQLSEQNVDELTNLDNKKACRRKSLRLKKSY